MNALLDEQDDRIFRPVLDGETWRVECAETGLRSGPLSSREWAESCATMCERVYVLGARYPQEKPLERR